jgi:hypothetical protein
VDVLRAGKCCERLCGDLLAVRQMKCTWGKMRWSVLAIGVTPGSLRPLITVGNLGAWLCIDIV